MALQETPVKTYKYDCCVCLGSNLSRYFNFTNDKCVKNNVCRNLSLLLGEEIDETWPCACICKSCVTKLDNTLTFIEKLKSSSQILARKNANIKRCFLSPSTSPTTLVSSVLSSVHQKKKPCTAKRSLDLPKEIPERRERPVEHSNSVATNPSIFKEAKRSLDLTKEIPEERKVPLEHSYSLSTTPSIFKEVDEVEVVLSDRLDDEPEDTGHLSQLLKKINEDVSTLTCLAKDATPSVLYQHRSIQKMTDEENLLQEILHEMKNRCPTLLDILLRVMTPTGKKPSRSLYGPVCMVYSVLLHQRNKQLSAFQRLMTMMAVKGHANDTMITRLNKLGLTLSCSSKLNILDECGADTEKRMIANLKMNSSVKITGDNMDMYIRTNHQSSDKHHVDLHMFTSNLIFSRIPSSHLPDTAAPTGEIRVQDVLLSPNERSMLLDSYVVLLARILVEHAPAFEWMKDVIPEHIPHNYADHMAQKSRVFPLPVMMKNESCYEQCLDILDTYEDQVCHLFKEAHGDTSVLDEKKVVIGGDQLTRVRLDGAKKLRAFAPDPVRRFHHLQPIVVEMWHTKQDMLHKAYKALFNKTSAGQPGTLYHFRNELRRTDVTGNVKSNFKAHWDFLINVGKMTIFEQLLEFFGMMDKDSFPSKHLCPPDSTAEKKSMTMKATLKTFLITHNYCSFSLDEVPAPQPLPPPPPPPVPTRTMIRYQVVKVLADGRFICKHVSENKPTSPAKVAPPMPDQLFNYSQHLSHWTLHLLQLHDTAREGDIERLKINTKYNIALFFSHSKLSKYFIENLDFVLKTQFLLSPEKRLRVLEGSFVNVRGGQGNNVEADLVQEHSVRNQKDLVRQLGANKTEKAMTRVTNAADTVAVLANKIDSALQIKTSSGRHTKNTSTSDITKIQNALRLLQPFKKHPGRECVSFKSITPSPTDRIDRDKFKTLLERNINRLKRGLVVDVDAEEEEDFREDGGDEDLPEV